MTFADDEKTFALIGTPANKKTILTLETLGAKVIPFPAARIEKSDLDEKSEVLLRGAHAFDWLIFFDVLSVDYFLAALEAFEIDHFELDRARICSIGEAVADRLRFVQIHSDIIPNRLETAAILTALIDYIGGEEIDGKSFLVIKRLAAQNRLKTALAEKGAVVAELDVYSAEIAEPGDNARLAALLKGGAVDEFVFSSPEDFIALEKLLISEAAAELLKETRVSAIGEVTFQFLRENNLKPVYFKKVSDC